MYPAGDGVMVLGPFQVGSLRIMLAALVLLPIAIKFRRFLNKENFWLLLVTGFFGNLMPAMMFTLAETNIDSSLAGLLNMSTSFFVVIIGVVFYKAPPSKLQLLGLALGSTGLYFVLSGQMDMSQNKNIGYAFFIFPATIGYAISLTTIKFKLNHLPAAAITSLSFLIILIPALILMICTGALNSIFTVENGLKAFGYVTILGVVGTAIAVLLFTRLIAISSHIFSSAVAYMLPVVAIFIGRLDGEIFPMTHLIWLALIIVGVFLMSKSKKVLANK